MTDPPRDEIGLNLTPDQKRRWYERVVAGSLLRAVAEEHWRVPIPVTVAADAIEGVPAPDLAQALAAAAVPAPHALQTILAPRQLDMLLAAIRNGAGPGTIANLLGITVALARKYLRDENLVAYGYVRAGQPIPEHLSVVVECRAVADWLACHAAAVRELALQEDLLHA